MSIYICTICDRPNDSDFNCAELDGKECCEECFEEHTCEDCGKIIGKITGAKLNLEICGCYVGSGYMSQEAYL